MVLKLANVHCIFTYMSQSLTEVNSHMQINSLKVRYLERDVEAL
jgi:hypothetical protein